MVQKKFKVIAIIGVIGIAIKADKLVELLELNYSDAYTIAAKRDGFVESFKIAVYKEGSVKLPAWIL